jgi:hypothetical protein
MIDKEGHISVQYQAVSISLAHTAKASEPIFNVIIAALLFGEHRNAAVYISLVGA